MKILLDLFLAFFRIGLFTIGGGYAMLPMLRREAVENYGWISEDELLDCYALGQCVPGVIATNAGTYVGYKAAGIPGAAAAAIGVVTPSFFIILIIAKLLKSAMTMPMVIHAFSGIRAAVAALVLTALISLFKNGVKNKLQFFVFAAAFVLAAVFDISPVVVVISAVILGILLEALGVKS